MQEIKRTTFAQELERTGHLVYTNKGISMMPLLRQDRDLMILKKAEPGTLKKLDAVLFIRPNGQYVLHRILEEQDGLYWIVGDNCVSGEYVREEQIIGVLTGVIRDGKTISVEDPAYQRYVHLWCDHYPTRIAILKVRNRIRALGGKALRTVGLRK